MKKEVARDINKLESYAFILAAKESKKAIIDIVISEYSPLHIEIRLVFSVCPIYDALGQRKYSQNWSLGDIIQVWRQNIMRKQQFFLHLKAKYVIINSKL